MQQFIDIIIQTIASLWYLWVFFGMLLESTFIPVPSEVIMIPAWYLASQWQMSVILLGILWTIWATIWATINYALWKYLWWPVVHIFIKKYGKYFLISEKHYLKTEEFFERHGSIATFTGRLLPWLRHLISIPAWVFLMPFKTFIIFTIFWAGIWNITLISLWYIAWENQELIHQYSKEITIGMIVSVGIIIWIYVWNQKRKK